MCLKAVANEIKVALKFKSVEFEYVLPPEALTEKCFPMLLKVVRVNVPQTNGYFDNADAIMVMDVASNTATAITRSFMCGNAFLYSLILF